MENILIRASQVFFAIFVVSIPFSGLGERHRSLISNNPFFQYMNSIFVTDYGVLWLSGVFWTDCICTWLMYHKSDFRYFVNRSSKYAFYLMFAIFFNAWFFGPSLVERLNVATGGHCMNDAMAVKSMSQCSKNSVSSWVNGFDLSGHYFFLITSSLLLIDTVVSKQTSAASSVAASEQHSSRIIKSNSIRILRVTSETIHRFTIALVSLWLFEFCITSIFFHTVWEKALGLLGIPIALGVSYFSDMLCSSRVNPDFESAV